MAKGSLLMVLLAAHLPVASHAFPPLISHRVSQRPTVQSTGPEIRVQALDWDGDGSDEILQFLPRRVICLRPHWSAWTVVWDAEIDSFDIMRAPVMRGLTPDGRPSLVVSSSDREGWAWLTAYHSPSAEASPAVLWRAGPFLTRCREEWMRQKGWVEARACSGVDAGGGSQLYVAVYPAADTTESRSILALDGSTGAALWNYPLGPPATSILPADPEEGNVGAIFVATCSPCNGFSTTGTSDTASYVLSLTPRGRLRWCRQMGGGFSAATIVLGDVDGDGKKELIAGLHWGQDGNGDSERPTVSILDPDSGRPRASRVLGTSVEDLRAIDLNGDGRDEILAGGSSLDLYCLDGGLTILWQRRNLPVPVTPITDLDGDGRLELVCVRDEQVSILDGRGHLLAGLGGGPGAWASPVVVDGRRFVAVKRGSEAGLIAIEEPLSSVWWVTVGLVVLSVGGVLVLRTRRTRRAHRPVRRGDAQQALLDALTAFGHGGASLKIMDRLRYWLINWEQAADQRSLADTPMPTLVGEFERTVTSDLLVLASLARRAGAPARFWRNLPGNVADASRSLQILMHAASMGGEAARRALQPLSEIDRRLKELRAHLRRTIAADPVPLAQMVLDDRRPDLIAAGVEGRLQVRADSLPRAFVPRELFIKVVDGLVSNSLRATEASSRKEIELLLTAEDGRILLDVRDSGCGIEERDLERVFDRSFTTKEDGGGFGLYYARVALAPYEGRIFVLASEPGSGATFRVTLRSAEGDPLTPSSN